MNKTVRCKKCVLDTSIKEIKFDSDGICNFCSVHKEIEEKYTLGKELEKKLNKIIDKIKHQGKNKKYDCIVGVSGGMDSTFTLYNTVKLGLRPLAVHLDNGWNSENAIKNINNATKILNVDLETIVLDWEEFKDLQISFLEASVPDGEVPTDWIIFTILYQVARKEKIKYIIHGHSFRTEGSSPLSWTYMDGKYVRSIHKKFGKKKIKNFSIMSTIDYIKFTVFHRINQFRILYYINYNQSEVLELMKKELNWSDYGGKHFESSYTSFYQAFVLYKKFGIDKRKLHLSALIRSNQIPRDKALSILKNNPYVGGKSQMKYVIKKLGLDENSFERIMNKPIKSFRDYDSNFDIIVALKKPILIANKLGLVPDSLVNKYFKL